MGGRYVPPHMRNRPSAPSTPESPRASANAGGPAASPARPTGRWDTNGTPSTSSPRTGGYSAHSGSSYNSGHTNGTASGSRSGDGPGSGSGSGYGRSGHGGGGGGSGQRRGSPSLYVFGDSFVGPFKLLADDCAKVQTFKGSSAKGLNNPNSIKQVSNELVPLLNQLLAPPPYAYLPATGRYALLIFGNVDLQINYLWQLQHKPIGKATWSEAEAEAETEEAEETSVGPAADAAYILATATENAGKGPALGPERFVDTVVKAYTSWLEREVVNGPIGRRATEVAAQASGERAGARKLAPTKVLVAGALPPLVEDPTLPRIPEKYVERLEEDHKAAHRALAGSEQRERGSRTPWSRQGPTSPPTSVSELERGMAATSLDTPGSATPTKEDTKASVLDLLKHSPPLCTKPVRVSMTQRFNDGLEAFCKLHPSVLSYVDISDVMRSIDKDAAAPSAADLIPGEVDRATWACPVDPSNIHPLWEPTLPLWLKALAPLGVPTESFAISADAEETFRNYEADKRRRTEEGEAKLERLKLRDE